MAAPRVAMQSGANMFRPSYAEISAGGNAVFPPDSTGPLAMGDRVATVDGMDLTSARYQVLSAVGSNQSSAPATLSAVQAVTGIRLANLEVLKLYNDAGAAKDVRVCFTML